MKKMITALLLALAMLTPAVASATPRVNTVPVGTHVFRANHQFTEVRVSPDHKKSFWTCEDSPGISRGYTWTTGTFAGTAAQVYSTYNTGDLAQGALLKVIRTGYVVASKSVNGSATNGPLFPALDWSGSSGNIRESVYHDPTQTAALYHYRGCTYAN